MPSMLPLAGRRLTPTSAAFDRIAASDRPILRAITLVGVSFSASFLSHRSDFLSNVHDGSAVSEPLVISFCRNPNGSCPVAWCICRLWLPRFRQGRDDQRATAGRLMRGSSLKGAIVSSVM